MKTLIIQSFRDHSIPGWIARCMDSVRLWAAAQGFDYQLAGDDSFQLCGEDYLAAVGSNMRSITNLSRLILVRQAHAAGYDRAIWMDADVFVFAPDQFRIDLAHRYAFARETWIWRLNDTAWAAYAGVNNSVFACVAGEPDLDFLIGATRHIALNRQITTNYQVGGDIIKGLRTSLGFQVLDNVGMFSHHMVAAMGAGHAAPLHAQARFHQTPIHAANLCAGDHYDPPVAEADAMRAMDLLEQTAGEAVNAWLAEGPLEAQTWPGYTPFSLSVG